MRLIKFTAVVSAILLCPAFLAATDVDPMDQTLIAYEASKADEDAFSGTDGKISEFWTALMENRDYKFDNITLTPEVNGVRATSPHGDGPVGEAFTEGKDDAQQWVYAAWGEKGLYLLIETQDDAFVGAIGSFDPLASVGDANYHWTADYWMNDCVDMCIDIYPSDELQNQWVECVTNQITNTTWQYQYRFGISDAPNTVLINFPSPGGIDRWNPDCIPKGSKGGPNGTEMGELNLSPISVSEALINYGIKIEIIHTGESKRAQEWFFPWNHVAAGRNMPSPGEKIAFSVQYNDMDPAMAGTATMPDVLFWINGGNPFFPRKFYDGMAAQQPVDLAPLNWGDIEFGGRIQDISGQTPVVRNITATTAAKIRAAKIYSIDGRRMSISAAAGKNPRIAVQRCNGNRSIVKTIIR
jgi:hypothetical protein